MISLKKVAVVVQAIVFLQGCSTLSELPPCDSSEAKDIVKEVVNVSTLEAYGYVIDGSACAVRTDMMSIAVAVSDESECNESVLAGYREPYRANAKITYVDDMVTDFSKYVVRSQEKSSDDLSIACSFSLELERKSVKADWSDSREIRKNLNLTLFKKDESGNRHYEYSWE